MSGETWPRGNVSPGRGPFCTAAPPMTGRSRLCSVTVTGTASVTETAAVTDTGSGDRYSVTGTATVTDIDSGTATVTDTGSGTATVTDTATGSVTVTDTATSSVTVTDTATGYVTVADTATGSVTVATVSPGQRVLFTVWWTDVPRCSRVPHLFIIFCMFPCFDPLLCPYLVSSFLPVTPFLFLSLSPSPSLSLSLPSYFCPPIPIHHPSPHPSVNCLARAGRCSGRHRGQVLISRARRPARDGALS